MPENSRTDLSSGLAFPDPRALCTPFSSPESFRHFVERQDVVTLADEYLRFPFLFHFTRKLVFFSLLFVFNYLSIFYRIVLQFELTLNVRQDR